MSLRRGRALAPTLLALALGSTSCARAPEHPNVLLITIDTLRADRFDARTMPELEALAAESLRFTHAETPRAKTTPAIASLLSGLYPHEHGVRDLTAPLARDVPLVQEAFRAAGYRTGAIVGNFVLTRERSGLERGFDLWVDSLPQTSGVPPNDVPQRTAGSLTDGALVALDLASDAERARAQEPTAPFVGDGEPWFLWLHYMDPHGSYDPPPEHRIFHGARAELVPLPDAPPRDALHRRIVADYNVPREALRTDGRIDAARARELYDGEVHFVDAEIGRLFARLRASGALAHTLIVVTADHGESLGEHDYWFEHGFYAYETTCRVPLLVRLPDDFSARPDAGVREQDVSLVDLAPTLLELAHVPPVPGAPAPSGSVRGSSRAALVLRGGSREDPVFVEKIEGADQALTVQIKAVRIGDWKLLRRLTHRASPDPGAEPELELLGEELYDLALDPLEERDLSRAPPSDAPLERLRAELTRFTLADAQLAELGRILEQRREALERGDRETSRILRALGY